MRRHIALTCLPLALLCGRSQAAEAVLGEVSVTARNDAAERRRNAATATLVVDREELETLDAASVGELLGKLPGTGLFGDIDPRRGKGKGADRFVPRILVDGQPLPGGERNPAAALRLPVELIERVEIHRNGTPEFPASGPGGVINLILRDVPPARQQSARIAVGEHDGSGVLRAEGTHGAADGDFGWLLAGSLGSRPNGGEVKSGIQEFTGGVRNVWRFETSGQHGRENQLSLSPRFYWNLGEGKSFTLSPFLSLLEDDRRTHIARQAYADPVAGSGLAPSGSGRENDDGWRGASRLVGEWKQITAGAGEWSARLTAQGEREARRKVTRDYGVTGLLTSDSGERNTRDERELSATLRGKRLVGDAHLVTGGVDWRGKTSTEESSKTTNGVPQAPGADSRADIDDRRRVVWVQDEWQLAERHLLTPGLRWQNQQSEVTDGDGNTIRQHHVSLDPSLHYLWQLTPAWNLRASATLAEKAPNAKELSPVVKTANGTNSAVNPDKVGNPGLAPERSRALELGIEHFLPERRGTVGTSLFHRRIEDQVQKLTELDSGRWVERPYNVGDAVLTGGLVDFKLLLDALTLRGNATYTETRITDPVPGLGAGDGPRKNANLGADYEFAALRLTFGGTFTWLGELDRERSATVRQTQGARRQLDLYALHRIDRHLRLRFSAQNVNRGRRDASSIETDASGVPTRIENDSEKTAPTFLIALEGKW